MPVPSSGEFGALPRDIGHLPYPAYVIEYPGSTVLVEHGHFCDPAIPLYLKDLADRTYRASDFDQFHWAMQRRDAPAPGTLTPVATRAGQNAYTAAKEAPIAPVRPSVWSKLWEWLKNRGGEAVGPVTEEWLSIGIEN